MEGTIENDGVHRFHVVHHTRHRLRCKRTFVDDLLFAYFAPARIQGGVIYIRSSLVEKNARTYLIPERWRVIWMKGSSMVRVIQYRQNSPKPCKMCRKLVAIAKVVLAELSRRIAYGLERCGDRGSLVRRAKSGAYLPPIKPVREGISPAIKLARPAVQLASAQ